MHRPRYRRARPPVSPPAAAESWLPRVRRPALAVGAGLLLLAAFPPVDWWWAAPVGVAVLLLTTIGTGPAAAWGLASLAYLVVFLPLLEWVRFLGVGPWLALVLLQSVIAGLVGPAFVFVDRASGGRRLPRALGVVGAVVAVEALRGRVPFGGLTWGRLAFSQADSPLLAWAAVGGAPLVTAMVTVVAIAVAALVRQPTTWRERGRAGALVAAPFLAALVVPLPVDGPTVSVAAVQGNVPRAGLDAFAEDLVVLDNHLAQTRQLAADVAAGRRPRPDLVIWPENAADQDPRTEPAARARVDAAVAALDQPLLLGAVLRDPEGLSNGLLVWGPTGVDGAIYRKRHLVPFGEYLPLRSLVEGIYPAARQLLANDFVPGDRVGRLELGGVPIAVATCFEVAFDDVARSAVVAGGELLVLPSNNASYGRSAQSEQQLAMARLRAVEHGRSTVVATTSGISALVRPDGRVVARSGLFEPAVLQADLPRRSQLTVASRWGGPAELALVALMVLPPAAAALGRPSRRAHAFHQEQER